MDKPDSVGPYQVVRKIGQGGMGVVYEGVQPQIERRVAIKILLPEYATNADISARFLNEARAANRVCHPSMVAVYEVGQLPDGPAYIIMEYLAGESLTQRIQRSGGNMGSAALRLGRQLATALAAVHAHGIVHRDLKPDNVMIIQDAESPSGERVKILDFGIAKLASELKSAALMSQPRTRTGMLLGTPLYMAPEQCRAAGKVDSKADVYALGVMLYEMLAGQPPFSAEGVGELMAMHLYQEPRPLTEQATWIAPDLAALVHSMLLKDPTSRPTMAEVAAALEEMGAPRAIDVKLPAGGRDGSVLRSIISRSQATGGNGEAAARRTVSRRRVPMILSAAAVILLVAGASLFGASRVGWRSAQGATPEVAWRISSEPQDASVIAESDGATLCSTPCVLRRTRGEGYETLVLRKPGFREQRLELPLTRDEQRHRRLDAEPKEAAPAEVRWKIDSDPPGAEVVRAYDGMLLGRTPWQQTAAAQRGTQTLLLRLDRYQPRTLVLDGMKDEERHEQLLKKKPKEERRDDYAIPVH